MQGLTIYKSSAGSGKTYTLVREYLRIVLENPTDYRHTLAITFTNKATQEMKSRIIKSLAELADGKNDVLKDDLQKSLPRINIQANAQMALDLILHDYSRFSVSTIDSFFQRIIRSLAREMNLHIRFDVEMDQDSVVDAITESLLEEAGKDKDLTRWLEELVLMKMDDDKGWKVEDDIRWVANELFTENFPTHSPDINREQLRAAIKEMRTLQREFVQQMQEYGKEATRIMADNRLSADDFYYGKRGVFGFFGKIQTQKYSNAEVYKPNSYVEKVHSGADWYSSKTPNREAVETIAANHLVVILDNIYKLRETSFRKFATAQEALKYIYIAGIISDLGRKLNSYRDENNLVFISDAPKILSSFITADDTPFVYEKFGTVYKHFLIDEFQDTSSMQWKNLLPLIRESLGSGHSALVVGDVKQSIYRWRGGNMQLLNNIKDDLQEFSEMIREENLLTNYRSRKLIVDFNNEFFTRAAQLVNAQLQLTDKSIAGIAYHPDELKQAAATHLEEGGFVRVKFFESDKKNETEENDSALLKWKEKAIKELIATINSLTTIGYEPRDIAILVRKNTHGNEIATALFESGIEKVISPDSLLLEGSPEINFLLSTLRFLSDQTDQVARAEVMNYYASYKLHKEELHELFTQGRSSKKTKTNKATTQQSLFDTGPLKDDAFNRLLPEQFTQHLFYLSKLPIYELVEQLISIFHLNRQANAYLQRFQDVVLEQTIKSNISVTAFIEWWEEHKRSFSVIVPENENAITIMTIHKSKGLQFPIVIIPWMDWKLGPNQRDLLWVKSDEAPYSELGLIPVKPTNALLETSFKEQFEDELAGIYTDNLNLMYVAMTRAEEQLYIYCEDTEEGELKNVANIMKRTVGEIASLKLPVSKGENANNAETYEAGEVKNNGRSVVMEEVLPLDNYIINRWQERISISSKARELQQMMNPEVKQKIDFGILVHRVLSEIKSKEEIHIATEKIFFEGIITKAEEERLKAEINNYFSIEGIELFYDRDWKVINEKEIMLPGGDVLRPDRVLIKGKQAMIVDFKTGKEELSHKKQVKKYADTLISMHYSEVKPFLVYINEKKIVPVN